MKGIWVLVWILTVLLVSGTAVACMNTASASKGMLKEGAYVTYYYDEIHDVGIWRSQNSYGETMFVLPASQFLNKERPMK